MRGRKPKPTATQIAEGDTRKRGVGKLKAKLASEPKPARGLTECPGHLTGRARAAWTFWAEELESMKQSFRPDGMMLEGACVNYARAVQADLIVDRDGPIVEKSTIDKESGEKIVLEMRSHPAITISNNSWKLVRSFCSEFGLSPVSRTRLSIEKGESSDAEFLDLLKQERPAKTPVTVQ